MSTPFGLDFGNDNSVLAVARNRGIDIVVNEVSNRSTPSVVGFGPKNRYLGETGRTKQTSNVKNTVTGLKRILGLKYDDKDMEQESKYITSKLVKMDDGNVGAQVRFAGEQQTYSGSQLAAMYMDKVKHTVIDETKANISDVCIAVPAWYTEEQRYTMSDAARIAGLNPVRIVNDVTAAAVSYGVFKTDLPEGEEKPRIVAFVDIGHSSYTCSIMAFKKGELKVLGTAYDKHFGGRDFDRAITEHFADEFKAKYKIDIRENAKAYNRIITAAEKLKKVLSANTTAPFSVESVMNDVDVSSQMTREELEELVKPLLESVTEPVTKALAMAGITADEVDFVEVIGGTTRIPTLKDSISKAFGKPLSTTLNQDEAIAKGAAFICAIHSPTLRVRPFKFEDIHPYSVSYSWDKQAEDEDTLEVFPKNTTYPSTKMITLHRTGDFNMEAFYTNKEDLPANVAEKIANWEITGVELGEGEESVPVKLKLRCDPSGLHTIEEAYTLEDIVVKEEIPLPEDAAEDAEPEFKEVTKTVKKADLTIVAHTFALEAKALNELIEKENELNAQDKLVYETEDRKNTLEEYIYTLRGKLDEEYSDFASDAEKTRLKEMLQKAEDWLYDDGYDSIKAKYIAKYEELASLGNLIKGRYQQKEEEKRQALRAKQESSQMADLAAKLSAQRKAEAEAKESKTDAEGDVDLD
ncbi:similar to Saccharomyces cerevisiae YBR169C SSE2 Member of the heat shock protein 70 (HSP70) family [Maudiozyma barnettii]|uniref:Similar to Saccharomyces cerevisiae YBR169C SSE2 Member of the heat shock protein 70 (HSP70) family n=1 Tax=Maudiozyma barnettii TaxID=61262 RepID=A0A8H2ZFP1_9SACH|nr:adenyl-nucleotide exchange factor SSE2 [Kazachstania barnettii]CAB4253659.1 similar to Saccharomyces cerevisiae YBR169C SSE2 Member of the heat shock protein 70 (HSP70) family [Kazachstania barnettii]CAD1781352.1 similar to Saccharomyces cerevisiae YBR169C SSE2 Member of the heat shock protein 70 (HSP70) family [Kazachstania barnettii]